MPFFSTINVGFDALQRQEGLALLKHAIASAVSPREAATRRATRIRPPLAERFTLHATFGF